MLHGAIVFCSYPHVPVYHSAQTLGLLGAKTIRKHQYGAVTLLQIVGSLMKLSLLLLVTSLVPAQFKCMQAAVGGLILSSPCLSVLGSYCFPFGRLCTVWLRGEQVHQAEPMADQPCAKYDQGAGFCVSSGGELTTSLLGPTPSGSSP